MSQKIITFANHKGGVSKTSLYRGLYGNERQESPAYRP